MLVNKPYPDLIQKLNIFPFRDMPTLTPYALCALFLPFFFCIDFTFITGTPFYLSVLLPPDNTGR
jgi:hypothetical protein